MNEFEAMTANVADLDPERVKMRKLIAAHPENAPEKMHLLARAMTEVGVAVLAGANEYHAARLLRRMRRQLLRGHIFDF